MNSLDDFQLRIGIVENKEDEDKLARVQIRVMPELQGVKKNDLPWARPFFTSGMDKNNYSMELPEVGADVFCLVKDDFKSFYYMQGIFVDGFFDYEGVVKPQLDKVSELSDSAYPNINFKLINDGTIFFHNTVNGDFGYIHSSGTYQIIDTNGDMYFVHHDGSYIKKNSDGIEVLDQHGNSVVMDTTGISLNSGDASAWAPNIISHCLFTGAPHGGSAAGIVKLKGG